MELLLCGIVILFFSWRKAMKEKNITHSQLGQNDAATFAPMTLLQLLFENILKTIQFLLL
jgi:hypothetical protein